MGHGSTPCGGTKENVMNAFQPGIVKWELITVPITEKMFAKAAKRNNAFFAIHKHNGTFRLDKKDQRMTGYLGEEITAAVYPKLIHLGLDDKPDFEFMSHTFDVKTQAGDAEPKAHFAGTLYANQADRSTDFYVFCRVSIKQKIGWICGLAPKRWYLKTASFLKEGDETNNFRVDQDRYSMNYGEMTSPTQLLKFLGD